MNGSLLKIMLVLMLLVIVAAGCGENTMSSKPNVSSQVSRWEMTPAGVYVPWY